MDTAADPSGGSMVFAAIVFGVCFVLYLLPWLIAREKNHRQKSAILALDIFLGWTFIGWVVALVWAFVREKEDPPRS